MDPLVFILLVALNMAIYEDEVGLNKGDEVHVCFTSEGVVPCPTKYLKENVT